MTTYRIDLAYDGAGFRGYATQPGLRTVQGVLEDALATVLGHEVATSVAGRTDAGVHARGQVVSFSTSAELDENRFPRSVSGLVGSELTIKAFSKVTDDFSARHSALWRRYRYLVGLGPPDPLRRGFVWTPGRDVDVGEMATAAAHLIGEHDFSSFCRSVPGRSNHRRIEELEFEEGEELGIWVRANAFCHQMVRSMVGHLYDVGRGFVTAESTAAVLAARDRSAVATVAPPHGLTLWEVGY